MRWIRLWCPHSWKYTSEPHTFTPATKRRWQRDFRPSMPYREMLFSSVLLNGMWNNQRTDLQFWNLFRECYKQNNRGLKSQWLGSLSHKRKKGPVKWWPYKNKKYGIVSLCIPCELTGILLNYKCQNLKFSIGNLRQSGASEVFLKTQSEISRGTIKWEEINRRVADTAMSLAEL